MTRFERVAPGKMFNDEYMIQLCYTSKKMDIKIDPIMKKKITE